eukprot:Em0015g1254a
MSNQSEDQPFQVVSRRNNGPSRKAPKVNHVKPTSSSHEEGSNKASTKLRPSHEARSRSQPSHLSQERPRRDSDRQSTGERSRHNSTRGTSSDDQELESSQERDCPVVNGIRVPESNPGSTQEEEQIASPQEVASATTLTKCEESTMTQPKYTYSRELLLSLRDSKYIWSKLASIPAECIKTNGRQRNASPTYHTEESRKHPTAVSLIKENDSKVQRVSLSPQRRSFGSGCSWKEASVGSTPPNEEAESRSVRPSNKERQWDPSNKERQWDPSNKERQWDPSNKERQWDPSNKERQWDPSNKERQWDPSNKERQWDPSNKERQWDPSNKERQWDPSNKERRDPSGRERRGSKQQPKITYKHDDEPEWMEFGPNDRSEVIELKGLEEHEREREEEIGRGEGDKQRVKDGEVGKGEKWRCGEDEEEVGRGGRKQSCGEDEPGGADTKPGACDETKVSVEQEGGEDVTKCEDLKAKEAASVFQQVGSEGAPDPIKVHSQTEPSQSLPLEDNFIVDGFDFSTGVSICLAMDEELEDSGENGVDGTADLFKRMQATADSPQALRVRPANALTLEEIQAKENITSSPSQQVENDHMRFNQILAVLSGSKSPGHTQPSGSASDASAVITSSVMLPPPMSLGVAPPMSLGVAPPMSLGVAPSNGLSTNSTLASFHLDPEVDNAHPAPPPPPTQHRVNYPHYPRPPPPRAANHMPSHPRPPPPWYQPDLPSKPQGWGDEERAMAGSRQQYMTASQNQTHWVSEMEQRRLVEAKQMYTHQIHHHPPPRAQIKTPGISLLPTSVMKHMYNTKVNQRVPDVTTATGIDRLEQEVPFRDYTVQSPQQYSTAMYQSSSALHFPIPGHQYSGFPSYPTRYSGPYSR